MTERLKEDARAMAMCAAPASRQFCRPKGSRFGRTAEGGKKKGGVGLLGACTVQPPEVIDLQSGPALSEPCVRSGTPPAQDVGDEIAQLLKAGELYYMFQGPPVSTKCCTNHSICRLI